MIELIRAALREVYGMIKENVIAFYGAAMTFIAAAAIIGGAYLFRASQKKEDAQLQNNLKLSLALEAMRDEKDRWKDSFAILSARFEIHLKQDIINSLDTTKHQK